MDKGGWLWLLLCKQTGANGCVIVAWGSHPANSEGLCPLLLDGIYKSASVSYSQSLLTLFHYVPFSPSSNLQHYSIRWLS